MSNNSKKKFNETEQKVLELLNKKKTCLYGDIIKDLNLSYSKGQEAIYALISRGIIEHCKKSSELQLKQ